MDLRTARLSVLLAATCCCLVVVGYLAFNQTPTRVAKSTASETTFNPLTATIRFERQGIAFHSDPTQVVVTHNGEMVQDDQLEITSQWIQIRSPLEDGPNELVLFGADSEGTMLEIRRSVWAGSLGLNVSVLDQAGQAVDGVVVYAALGDDQNVSATGTSTNGGVLFQHLPARTIVLSASHENNSFAYQVTRADAGRAELRLRGFGEPSSVNNNDFSRGLEGWDTGNSPVRIIPHDSVNSFKLPSLTSPRGASIWKDRSSNRTFKNIHHAVAFFERDSTDKSTIMVGRQNTVASQGDLDLVLQTAGQGPRTISRTFKSDPDTRMIKLRYRFVTTEVPGGYFGSQYNDFFFVSIRSKGGGGSAFEGNSMNGLGIAAFDANGATTWREVSLPIENGDTVEAEITVANVADGFYDSMVVVDLISETSLAITQLDLRDIDNTDLRFLSTDAHNYFGGQTRIHGTITVVGGEDDELTFLELELIQRGVVVARADLAEVARRVLLVPFGEARRVAVTTSQLLFELTSAQAVRVDGSANDSVLLRAKATSAKGEEATREYSVAPEILVRYTQGNRYGPRDQNEGGDDWVKPSVKPVVEHFTEILPDITFSDFSNMNGGENSPHVSHQTGNDVDCRIPGYSRRDAETARQLLDLINQSFDEHGRRIEFIGATHDRESANDPFWQAIHNVNLNDGRTAREVIRPWAGHTHHFHVRLYD